MFDFEFQKCLSLFSLFPSLILLPFFLFPSFLPNCSSLFGLVRCILFLLFQNGFISIYLNNICSCSFSSRLHYFSQYIPISLSSLSMSTADIIFPGNKSDLPTHVHACVHTHTCTLSQTLMPCHYIQVEIQSPQLCI